MAASYEGIYLVRRGRLHSEWANITVLQNLIHSKVPHRSTCINQAAASMSSPMGNFSEMNLHYWIPMFESRNRVSKALMYFFYQGFTLIFRRKIKDKYS